MPITQNGNRKNPLPNTLDELVRVMIPQAIMNDTQHENVVEMIDRLMVIEVLSEGQAIYLETLLELVEHYEAAHHTIDTSNISGLDSLRHLLAENDMNASDLGRLLGVHPSMGSKILKGERALTVDHLKALAARFRVDPSLFIDLHPPQDQSKTDKNAA